MINTKPTIVLIHGALHVPETYSKLTNALRVNGYEVHVPAMLSMNGSRPPNAGLPDDTKLIRSYVASLVDAGRRVIAIMHSYGGQVGTNALVGLGVDARKKQGLSGGVSHLIYMCAFAMPEGRSMVDKVREFGHEELLPLAFDFAEDKTVLCRDPKTIFIGPGLEEKEYEEYVGTLRRWNGDGMYQEIQNAAWREIPVTYIYTTQDMALPFDYQKSMVERMKAEGRDVDTVELITGHAPNATATKEMVDAVNQAAAKA